MFLLVYMWEIGLTLRIHIHFHIIDHLLSVFMERMYFYTVQLNYYF